MALKTPGGLREEPSKCPTHKEVMEMLPTTSTAQALQRTGLCSLGDTEQACELPPVSTTQKTELKENDPKMLTVGFSPRKIIGGSLS